MITNRELTEAEIESEAAAIEADAGRVLPGLRDSLTEAVTGGGRRTTPEQIEIIDTRQSLGLSQSAFATVINTPLRTLQEWEQGRSQPVGAVVKLCQLLRENPGLAEVS